MAQYPTVTYFLTNHQVLFYIPDLSVVVELDEDEYFERDGTWMEFPLDLDRLPDPSSAYEIELDPEVLFGANPASVEHIQINWMEIKRQEAPSGGPLFEEEEEIDPQTFNSLHRDFFELLANQYGESDEGDEDEGKESNLTQEVRLSLSSELLRLLNEHNISLSQLVDEAIIEKLFFGS